MADTTTATLYVRDLDTIPTAYVTSPIVFDDDSSADWQSTICPRCSTRFREHDWALYVITADHGRHEAALDCSVMPR